MVLPDNPAPSMDIIGGCNRVIGSFEVLDVAYADDGTPLRLAVNLEHYCAGGPRADRVRIRFNTTVPLDPPGVTADAGTDMRGAPGTTVALDASISRSTFAGALAYTWSQLSGPPVVIDDVHAAQPRVTL